MSLSCETCVSSIRNIVHNLHPPVAPPGPVAPCVLWISWGTYHNVYPRRDVSEEDMYIYQSYTREKRNAWITKSSQAVAYSSDVVHPASIQEFGVTSRGRDFDPSSSTRGSVARLSPQSGRRKKGRRHRLLYLLTPLSQSQYNRFFKWTTWAHSSSRVLSLMTVSWPSSL